MADKSKATIRVGPAGWSYDDWKGVVYPPEVGRAVHPLSYLSRYFDTVEVNSSFYRPPDPRHCASWLEKVSENGAFMFTMKLWERFTHQRDAWPSDEEIERVRHGMGPIVEAGKLGALLVQFPWSFKRTPENRRWLSRIIETFEAYTLAVEIRHASWDVPEVYAGLAERGVSFCNIDQPVIGRSIEPSATVTHPVAYVRLHGRNYDDWFRKDAGRDNRYNYLYSLEELDPWIERIFSMTKSARDVYVVTNNHFQGHAVVNAFELQDGLGIEGRRPPNPLAKAFPRLGRIGAPD